MSASNSDGKRVSLQEPRIDHKIFWPSIIILLAVIIPVLMNPVKGGEIADLVLWGIMGKFGWMYMVFGFAALLFLAWLAFGPYGNVKLGKPGEKPEFSLISFIAMLFCGGIGVDLIYWSVIEPIYYMDGPPFGIAVGTAEAAEWAAAYGIFHWGFVPWALFALPAVPLSYAYYVRRNHTLRLSIMFKGQFGKLADGIAGKIVDIFALFAIMAGIGIALAFGVPMLSATVSEAYGFSEGFNLNIVIIVIWTLIFGTSVYRGLEKGIKVLSLVNVYLGFALLLFVLIAGPTHFIVNTFTNSLGLVAQNFFRMTLWTDPIAQGGWPEGWTMFFFAWWLACAPFLSLFIARISRGRTIREVVLGTVVFGSLGAWLHFAIYGGYGLNVELYGVESLTSLMAEHGASATIAAIFASLPFGKVVMPLFIVLMFVFLATTLDSGAYVFSSITTENLGPDQEPARWNRLLWSAIMALAGTALLMIGGLEPIQALAVACAFPLVFLITAGVICFLKDIKQDCGNCIKTQEISIDFDEATNSSKAIVDNRN